MLPLPLFRHCQPTTLDEAVALLKRHGSEATLIAGGTDLLPNMKHGLAEPKVLVSLKRVASLSGIHVDAGTLRIGAMTTLDELSLDPRVLEHLPALAQAAGAVGGPHHRRMGTLGGNVCLDTRCRYYNQTWFWRNALGYCLKKDGTVCHVVPGGQRCVAAASNDTAPAILALGGTLSLVGPKGERTIAAREFYTADGVSNTVRESDEIVTAVTLPLASGRRSAFEKLRLRQSIDYPLLSVAVAVHEEGGRVRQIHAVVSALAARPRVLAATRHVPADALLQGPWVRALLDAATKECRPLTNIDVDPAWRQQMVGVVLGRALERVGVITDR